MQADGLTGSMNIFEISGIIFKGLIDFKKLLDERAGMYMVIVLLLHAH